ncbi:MAG: cytochrome C, partial [Candidatus Zixiibacteriota bacterium]
MKWITLGLLSLAILSASCSPRADEPIMPVRDYERMIVGRLDADYVGNEACLAKCHKHDLKRDNFDKSVHGEQVDAASG